MCRLSEYPTMTTSHVTHHEREEATKILVLILCHIIHDDDDLEHILKCLFVHKTLSSVFIPLNSQCYVPNETRLEISLKRIYSVYYIQKRTKLFYFCYQTWQALFPSTTCTQFLMSTLKLFTKGHLDYDTILNIQNFEYQ